MIEGLPLVGIGAPSLLGLVVMLVITDRLVWHKRLDMLQKQIEVKDAQIADLTAQNTLMLQSAIPTVNAVLGALREAADGSS